MKVRDLIYILSKMGLDKDVYITSLTAAYFKDISASDVNIQTLVRCNIPSNKWSYKKYHDKLYKILEEKDAVIIG